MKTVCWALLTASALAASPDVTGQWTGPYQLQLPSGETQSATVAMTLKQTGSEITGTAGPAEGEQWPITKGKIEGDTITFDLQSDGPLFKVQLKLVDGHLKGEATGEGQEGTLKATLDLTKRPE